MSRARLLRRPPVLAAALFAALALPTGSSIAAERTVHIRGVEYAPATIRVRAGDTIVWSNARDNTVHTATADDGSFDTGVIPAGGQASETFRERGTIRYHCEIVPSMTGTIVVEAAAASPPPTPPASREPAPTGSPNRPVWSPDERTQPPTDTEAESSHASTPWSATVLALVLLAAVVAVLLRLGVSGRDRSD